MNREVQASFLEFVNETVENEVCGDHCLHYSLSLKLSLPFLWLTLNAAPSIQNLCFPGVGVGGGIPVASMPVDVSFQGK